MLHDRGTLLLHQLTVSSGFTTAASTLIGPTSRSSISPTSTIAFITAAVWVPLKSTFIACCPNTKYTRQIPSWRSCSLTSAAATACQGIWYLMRFWGFLIRPKGLPIAHRLDVVRGHPDAHGIADSCRRDRGRQFPSTVISQHDATPCVVTHVLPHRRDELAAYRPHYEGIPAPDRLSVLVEDHRVPHRASLTCGVGSSPVSQIA